MRRYMHDHQLTVPDEQIDAVNDHLQPNSPAERHMKGLAAASVHRASLAEYLAELARKFPGVKGIERTPQQYEVELCKMRITMEELAQEKVKVGALEIHTRDHIANRIKDLASDANISSSLSGYALWKDNQPSVITKALTPTPQNWEEVAAKIRAIPLSDLRDATAIHQQAAALWKDMVSNMTRMFQSMRAPSYASLSDHPAQTPGPPQPRQAPLAVLAPPRSQPFQPRPPCPPQMGGDYVPTTEELAQLQTILEQVICVAQPDTPEGQATYAGQVAKWQSNNRATQAAGMLRIESTGFPLKPGTVIPGSGEYWWCGMPAHRGGECKSLVPDKERRFRTVCDQWLRPQRGPAPVAPPITPVNNVGT
ncbi:unnamed protein product [Mycena citricolor]|uniref:Uncharacterized protein n=1 Tax=Mycena citricolor TaxID=2018698 RepID=A0AAD2HIP1_9AGAR|nr:unnamed protein product [Mycena citricolor]